MKGPSTVLGPNMAPPLQPARVPPELAGALVGGRELGGDALPELLQPLLPCCPRGTLPPYSSGSISPQ